MKYIAKEDLNCAFGILKAGDSFEAEPNDDRVAMLMVDGKIVSAEEEKPEPKKSKKAKKAPEVEEPAEVEPEAEETAEEVAEATPEGE